MILKISISINQVEKNLNVILQKTPDLYQPVDEEQMSDIYVQLSACLKRSKMKKDIEESLSSPMHDFVPMSKTILTYHFASTQMY